MSIVLSSFATLIALAAFLRTVFQQLPTVEFLVENDEENRPVFMLSVSNPTRRQIVLDYVRVLSPNIVTGFVGSDETIRGSLERNWEGCAQPDQRLKAAFLAVPAGETKCLYIVVDSRVCDREFGVDFRFEWSRALPHWDRWLMPRKITLDSAQVKSRKISAFK